MTLVVRYTVAARTDIESLYDYTLVTWGRSQADRYVDDLQTTIERLGANRSSWRAMVEWQPNGYRARFRHHVVFFVVSGDTLTIARVLHERRDVLRHLIEKD